MARIKTWEISDAFWRIFEPLIPQIRAKLEKNMPASRAVAQNQSTRTDSFSRDSVRPAVIITIRRISNTLHSTHWRLL